MVAPSRLTEQMEKTEALHRLGGNSVERPHASSVLHFNQCFTAIGLLASPANAQRERREAEARESDRSRFRYGGSPRRRREREIRLPDDEVGAIHVAISVRVAVG